MYAFPPAANVQCFVGDEIGQVLLDPHSVQFSFASGRRLMAELGLEQIEPNGTVWAYDCEAAEGPPVILHRLVYRPIVAVERNDFRLTFRIEGGSALVVLSELGPYEAGHMETSEHGFVVF